MMSELANLLPTPAATGEQLPHARAEVGAAEHGV